MVSALRKAYEGDPERVVDYLSRYTHRIAISEARIVDIGRESIHFRWKDYRDGQQKIMRLTGAEFVRRFMQHVLPKGLMRVRRYGFLANEHRKKKLTAIRKILRAHCSRRRVKVNRRRVSAVTAARIG